MRPGARLPDGHWRRVGTGRRSWPSGRDPSGCSADGDGGLRALRRGKRRDPRPAPSIGTTRRETILAGMPAEKATTVVYTDGACSGNPGPGGWAWVEPDGAFAAGFVLDA